jgi:osmotically-inducible protein OsmY
MIPLTASIAPEVSLEVAKTETRNDNSIRDDVLFELRWDPKIRSNDIAVAVKEGVVTLAGFVSNYWEKLEAEKAAKRVSGVRGVANDIEVRLASKRTDPEIARAAVHVFENNVSIPADQIKVTVKSGWVTLEGTVDWQYQKKLAESAVKKLRGVIGITNDIEVKPQVTPTEVKNKIEEALRRSAELDAGRVFLTNHLLLPAIRLLCSRRSKASKSSRGSNSR